MVLYEAVAGRHPVSGRSIFETLDLISRCAIPPVQSLAPDCPAALAEFLETALAIDPAVRPATAREMASRLRAVEHAP
jgi:serine/threonine protein kinase